MPIGFIRRTADGSSIWWDSYINVMLGEEWACQADAAAWPPKGA
ncbi:MAG: hypothetical protein ACYC5M_12095 [Anaerolineae bacterium]